MKCVREKVAICEVKVKSNWQKNLHSSKVENILKYCKKLFDAIHTVAIKNGENISKIHRKKPKREIKLALNMFKDFLCYISNLSYDLLA